MAKFIVMRSFIAAKLESTPYTFEPMSNSDYDIPAKEVSLELSQENHEQKYTTRNMSTQEVVKGRQTAKITFTVPLKTSGVAGTPPKEGKLLKACGMREILGTFGVIYSDDGSITSYPISIQFGTESAGSGSWTGILWKFRGCMGNVEEKVNAVGEPIERTYEFQGAVEDVVDLSQGQMPSPTGMDTAIPLSTKGTNLKLFNYVMNAGSMTFNQNNVINVHTTFAGADGNEGAYRVDHNPGGSLDPYMDSEANQFIYKRMTGVTGTQTGEFSYRAGATGNNGANYRLISPSVQILQSHNPADREGGWAHQMEFRSLGAGVTGMEPSLRIYGNPTGIAGYANYYGT